MLIMRVSTYVSRLAVLLGATALLLGVRVRRRGGVRASGPAGGRRGSGGDGAPRGGTGCRRGRVAVQAPVGSPADVAAARRASGVGGGQEAVAARDGHHPGPS